MESLKARRPASVADQPGYPERIQTGRYGLNANSSEFPNANQPAAIVAARLMRGFWMSASLTAAYAEANHAWVRA
jgi:hypothetical protein